MTTELHQLNHCLELDDQCPHSRQQVRHCLSSLVAATGSTKTISDADWLLIPEDIRNGLFLCWLQRMEEVME